MPQTTTHTTRAYERTRRQSTTPYFEGHDPICTAHLLDYSCGDEYWLLDYDPRDKMAVTIRKRKSRSWDSRSLYSAGPSSLLRQIANGAKMANDILVDETFSPCRLSEIPGIGVDGELTLRTEGVW